MTIDLVFDEVASKKRLENAVARIEKLSRLLLHSEEFVKSKVLLFDPEESRRYKEMKAILELSKAYRECKALGWYVHEDDEAAFLLCRTAEKEYFNVCSIYSGNQA